MKRLLPGRVELAIFSTLAILLAAIAWSQPKTDLFMALFAIPLFVTCAVLGMRRNPAIAPVRQESRRQPEAAAAEQELGA